MSGTAHIDIFARDRLPPAAQQPEFLFELPALQFPSALNCTEALLDHWIAAGEGARIGLYAPSELSWTYRDRYEHASRIAKVLIQVVKAFVVLKEGCEGGDSRVREPQGFVRTTIDPCKCPGAIEFLPTLPRTESGKVQRFRPCELDG